MNCYILLFSHSLYQLLKQLTFLLHLLVNILFIDLFSHLSFIDIPSLYARVIYPPGFNRDCKTQYPVLFYVYGGPNSQMVRILLCN